MRVLFMQSQSFFGSDSGIHALMMRHFDRGVVQPYAALTTANTSDPAVSAADHLKRISDLRIRPTDFGPSLYGVRGLERTRRLASAPTVPLSLLSLASYIRREQIQLIHGTEKPRDAFYGVLLGKLTGARSVVHLHVKYEDWITRPVKWALRHADAIVGVSRFVAQSAIEAGHAPERVFHVVNGIDLSSSKWDPALDPRPGRRSLGVADGSPLIGITSRLYRWKGHHDLLDALAIVKQEIPDVRLAIIGEDDPRAHPGGGSYRAELESQARRLNLENQVIFTGFRTDIPDLLAAFDVFAMPTWEEPCAVAFLEAMAMGKPVVAWDSGGTPELVVNGRTGFVVEPRSIPALADSLIRLLRDADLRRRIGQEGRRRVEQVLTPARMCESMSAIYREILSRRPSIRHVA